MHDHPFEQASGHSPEALNPRRAMLAGLGGLAAGAFLASTANAGPLTPPPGPISSTPGPEPRIPINSTNTPGSSATSSVFRITQSGSYYLTGNINSTNTNRHVIVVAADRVTIDLNGFSIRGLGTIQGAFDCIFAEEGFNSITVRNGFVHLAGRHGVNLSSASQCAVEAIGASSCISGGIRTGTGSRIIGCTAQGNGSDGITTGTGSAITNCTATSNAGTGITGGLSLATGIGCTITECAASSNAGYGVHIGRGGVVANCAFFSNGTFGIYTESGCTVTNCTARENLSIGIYAASNSCTIIGCTAYSNHNSGIAVFNDCVAKGNTSDSNGPDGTSAGIVVIGSDNRIEDNNCTDNSVGIQCTGSGNFIARNTCSGNSTNWNIAANNKCLVVNGVNAPAITGDAGGTSPGSTNPNANYTY